MPLFTVKPSRGAVVFFALVVLGVAGRHAFGRRELEVARRDGPPAHTARRLLRCTLGRDADRLFWPPAPLGTAAQWREQVDQRLRSLVPAEYGTQWPSRCIPIAERLSTRLNGVPGAAPAQLAVSVATRRLRTMAEGPMDALSVIESGALGESLVEVARTIVALSSGAESGWVSALADAPTDLVPQQRTMQRLPLQRLPLEAEGTMFFDPGRVLYQRADDHSLHLRTLSPDATDARDARDARDTALGRGIPVRDEVREGIVRIADDAGDRLLVAAPGEAPAWLALPREVQEGTLPIEGFRYARTGSYHWLLFTGRDGTPHLFRVARQDVAPRTEPQRTEALRTALQRSGPQRTEAPRAEAPRADGYTEVPLPVQWTMQCAGLSLVPDGVDRVAVYALLRSATGLWVEQTQFDDVQGRAARVDVAEPEAATWLAFAPKVRGCSYGGGHYLIVASIDGLTLLSLAPGRRFRATFDLGETGNPSGRFELTCNARGAVLLADFERAPGAVIAFTGEPVAQRLLPPAFGAAASTLAATMLEDGSVLALVQHRTLIRSYRLQSAVPVADVPWHWTGGDIVAESIVPSTNEPDPVQWVRVDALQSSHDGTHALASVRRRDVRSAEWLRME